jgi:uncharacterized protein (TIGR02596 family)
MNVITLPIGSFLPMKTFSSKNRGFSLLELIVVILIIGIVAAFVVPAAGTILKGSQLTQASQIVVDQISLARQQALTRNHMVEVRLIRFANPEVPGEVDPNTTPNPAKGAFRAIHVFEILDNGAKVPVDKAHVLPQAIIMNAEKLSSLIGEAKTAGSPSKVTTLAASDPELPGKIKKNYEYVCFRYLPDGSTDLPPTGIVWYLTLHNMNEKVSGSTPPNNFYTLQIDPVIGTTKNYRPSL